MKALFHSAHGLLGNIAAGTRLALFLPCRPGAFRVSYGQLGLLVSLTALLPFVADFFLTLPDHSFSVVGFVNPTLLCFWLFASLVLIVNMHGAAHSLLLLCVMFLAPWLFFWFLQQAWPWGLNVLPVSDAWWVVGMWGWMGLIAWRIFRMVLPSGPLLRAANVGIFVFVNLYAVAGNQVPLPFWEARPAAVEQEVAKRGAEDRKPEPDGRNRSHSRPRRAAKGGRGNIDVESVYYRQSEMVAKRVASLARQREGVIDMYFVGFAGHAAEDVFKNEVLKAQRLFEEEFGAAGRTVSLINNADTVQDTPLANIHNLRIAVQEVGAVLDKEEDVLVLYLSSHGSEGFELSTEFRPFLLNPVSPKMVREALELAGIKWRLIIISACYSGGFIEELYDENSLIITAARDDRKSFGCGHHGDYTWFGQALIGDNLRPDYSVQEAFSRAVRAIRKREQEKDYRHSHPQIRVGHEIGPYLEKMRKRLVLQRGSG